MSGWKEVRLGEIADIQTGPFGSQLHKEDYVKNGTPIVTVEHLGNKQFNTNNLPCVTDSDRERLSKYIAYEGDVVFSRVGSVDRCSYVDKTTNGWLFSGRCLRVRPFNNVSGEYLYYYFNLYTTKQYIRNVAVGTTMPSINTNILSDVPILLPSFETQYTIASILSSLDDKIAVNKKICENLEAQAQALFKHWFVDFAPFKDGKFVESELGLIPEGMIYKRIEDMPHTLETGKRPSGGVKGIDSGIPSIGAENIKGLGCYDFSKTKYVTEEFASTMKKGIINGYELLIYKDGGKPGYFIPNFAIFGEGYPYDSMCLNEHVFKLDFGNKGYSLFTYFYFKTKQIMSYLNAQGAKAAIPGINSKDIDAIMMPSLENECVKQFCSEVEDFITQILVLSKESAKLAILRDTLLPKLMSGEISLE